MDADKKARIKSIAGFLCLGLALLNATAAILAKIAEKNVLHTGNVNLAIAVGLFAVGLRNLDPGKPPPDALRLR